MEFRRACFVMGLAAAAAALSACGGNDQEGSADEGMPTAAVDNAAPSATAAASGEAPSTFVQCAICHSVEPGKNGLGPTLHGVVGRKAAAVEGFSYSPAMQQSGLVWDEQTLERYIENPRGVVPGTKMAYAGLKDAQKRAEIIAYLVQQK
jgi:cytochrome c2